MLDYTPTVIDDAHDPYDIPGLFALSCICGAPLPSDDAVFCADCRSQHENLLSKAIAKTAVCSPAHPCDNPNHNHSAIYVGSPACRSCGDPDGPLCAACTSTEEWCTCGAAATTWAPAGLIKQPMCAACKKELDRMARLPRAYAIAEWAA